MIPEIEELMDTGIVTKTTALAMMRMTRIESDINKKEPMGIVLLVLLGYKKPIDGQ